MDAGLLFWSAALANMSVLVSLALMGVWQARLGRVERHRRLMLIAAGLVGLFVLSYLAKLALLGGEDLASWSPIDGAVLRVHETCVLVMLLGGIVAGRRAWRMRKTRKVTRRPEDPPPPPSVLRWHRRAGWSAVVGALLGLLTAILVLAGMFRRAGF
jgi:uncharacterized membrane protein YozB (DUF420 family)